VRRQIDEHTRQSWRDGLANAAFMAMARWRVLSMNVSLPVIVCFADLQFMVTGMFGQRTLNVAQLALSSAKGRDRSIWLTVISTVPCGCTSEPTRVAPVGW
jgi:hypothetical protein